MAKMRRHGKTEAMAMVVPAIDDRQQRRPRLFDDTGACQALSFGTVYTRRRATRGVHPSRPK